jgi:hypothetical protein
MILSSVGYFLTPTPQYEWQGQQEKIEQRAIRFAVADSAASGWDKVTASIMMQLRTVKLALPPTSPRSM